jgi:hypothetical protein
MIIYDHKLIFIHVPKTGGTSITRAMGLIEPPAWYHKHAGWRIYKSQFPSLWEEFTKFAVYREQDSHAKSWYNFMRKTLSETYQSNNFKPYDCSFDEWISRGKPFHEFWEICGVSNPLDQYDFIGPKTEGVKILKFENLQTDWENFILSHGLPETWLNLPKENVGPKL